MRHRARRICLIVAFLLTLLALIPFFCWMHLRGSLQEQTAAERWRGNSEAKFAQISCFMDESVGLAPEQEYSIRKNLEDALAGGSGERWVMAMSGSCSVTAARDSVQVAARGICVSGSFYHFHPMQMVSGSWFDPGEVNRDGVVLDMQLAWKLFGGYDLQGMSITVDGVPVQIAGVARLPETGIEHDIYGQTPTLWLSMDLMDRLGFAPLATCVEAVLPNPVSDYAAGILKGAVAFGDSGDMVENTGRFSLVKSLSVFLHPEERVVRTSRVAYPFWENAARVAESRCGIYVASMALLLLFPCAVCIYWLFHALSWVRGRVRGLIKKRR